MKYKLKKENFIIVIVFFFLCLFIYLSVSFNFSDVNSLDYKVHSLEIEKDTLNDVTSKVGEPDGFRPLGNKKLLLIYEKKGKAYAFIDLDDGVVSAVGFADGQSTNLKQDDYYNWSQYDQILMAQKHKIGLGVR